MTADEEFDGQNKYKISTTYLHYSFIRLLGQFIEPLIGSVTVRVPTCNSCQLTLKTKENTVLYMIVG